MTAQPRSLQTRLLLLVVGLVAVVWMLVAIITWIDVRHQLDELLDSHLAQSAGILVARQVHPEDDDDFHADDGVYAENRYARKVAFQVFHAGTLALRSAAAPMQPMRGAVDRAFRSGFETVRIENTDWRVFAAYGAERDIQVYVGERLDSRASIVWAALRSMLWPMLVALPLLALVAWWAIYRGLAPLRRLGQALEARSPRSLEHVRVAGAPTEMDPMLGALNDLFDRIAELMESERRFTADAAHELRTPIAGIRTQAQVALADDSEAGRRHALESTLRGCDRASRLVEQLLTLSRIESGEEPVMVPLDLGALARDVLAEQVPGVMQRRQFIALQAAPGCIVKGDAVLLSVLVRNLVDNASRYSPDGARIEVTVERHPSAVALQIADSGSGMLVQDIARFGERFFRVVGNAQAGSGLGGSIVLRIAAAHGGQLRVGRSARLGGLEVNLALPPTP